MADIIDFSRYQEERDPGSMTREELLAYLQELQVQIADLDAREPKNMMSEAHEEWGELHEELEDLLDDVMDLLDET